MEEEEKVKVNFHFCLVSCRTMLRCRDKVTTGENVKGRLKIREEEKVLTRATGCSVQGKGNVLEEMATPSFQTRGKELRMAVAFPSRESGGILTPISAFSKTQKVKLGLGKSFSEQENLPWKQEDLSSNLQHSHRDRHNHVCPSSEHHGAR